MLSAEIAQVTVLKIPSLGMAGSKIGTQNKKQLSWTACLQRVLSIKTRRSVNRKMGETGSVKGYQDVLAKQAHT